MERMAKTWGERWLLFRNDLCEVSFLDLNENQRCSWHSHRSKFNLFFVTSGEIEIKTDDGRARVHSREIFTTRPGEMHEFRTPAGPAKIIEVMYVRYDPEDIDREDIGGKLNVENDTLLAKIRAFCRCDDLGFNDVGSSGEPSGTLPDREGSRPEPVSHCEANRPDSTGSCVDKEEDQ
jgi:mannose-6-phosphate isomerase-like protein (cupin superfamily)